MRTPRISLPISMLVAAMVLSAMPVAAATDAKAPPPTRLLQLGSATERDGMLRFRAAEIEPGAVQAAATPGGLLVFSDPDGGQLAYQYVSHREHADGVVTWVGRAEGAALGQEAVITIGPEGAFGRMPRANGQLLQLETVRGQTRLMVDDAAAQGLSSELQVDDAMRPTIEEVLAAGKARIAAAAIDGGSLLSNHNRLDVLMTYTTSLADYAGGDSAARTLLQNRIDIGNQALANAGVDGTFNMVAAVRVDFGDERTNGDALRDITNWDAATAHPLALRLVTLRHRHGADVVGMVRRFDRDLSVSCGNGWVGAYNGSPIANSVRFGYFTASHGTDDGFFCSDRTIAHEIGHNLGQNHDIDNNDNKRDGAHVYSHGHRTTPAGQNGFYTVMAYRDGSQAPALSFSNPGVTRSDCSNLPCGVANEADVARSLNITLPGAAAWIKSADTLARDIVGTRGHLDLVLNGLPALTNARWYSTYTGDGRITVTGPVAAPAGANVTARVAWDALPAGPSTPTTVRVVAESSPGVVVATRDLLLTRRDFVPEARVLANNVPVEVTVPAWNRNVDESRLYFEAPPHANSVRVRVTSTVDVDIYANRAGSVEPRAPLIGPGTARTAPVASDNSAALTKEITVNLPAGPGTSRVMVTLTRPASGSLNYAKATVTAWVPSHRTAPAFRSGQYFNTDRPGHGVFVDFSTDQWVAVWYTYLEDGTPTWYYSQAPAPAAGSVGIWSAPLVRVGWNGSSTVATEVGRIVVTPSSTTSMIFSYNLDGDSGSETLDRLGGGGCPTSQGQPMDGTGHWYSPSLAGFGYSVQFEPDLEIYTPYAYDSSGIARWFIGAKPWSEGVTQVAMEQITGSCPTCGFSPTSSRLTGSLTRTIGVNQDGKRGVTNININAPFLSPLSGVWNQARATDLLVSRKNCL